MQMKIELKPNLSIVFIGDSITDADRFEAAYKPFACLLEAFYESAF